jgi:hypothetical protein
MERREESMAYLEFRGVVIRATLCFWFTTLTSFDLGMGCGEHTIFFVLAENASQEKVSL